MTKPTEKKLSTAERAKLYDQRRKEIESLFETHREGIDRALPNTMSSDRFVSVCLSSIWKNPEIMDCTDVTILSSAMTCAQLGLFPDGAIGEAFFSVGGNKIKECELIVGYKGFCTLAMRSGKVKSIEARPVFAGDFLDFEHGTGAFLTHRPKGQFKDEDIIAFYCQINLMSEAKIFEVMWIGEILEIKVKSKGFQLDPVKSAWVLYFKDMGKKTAIKRLMKLTPLSPEIQKAVGLDDLSDAGKQNTVTDFINELGDNYKEAATEHVLNKQDEKKQSKREEKTLDSKAKGVKSSEKAKALINAKNPTTTK